MTAGLPSSADVLLGPGDDAAVVAAADGRVVVTTDMLVEGVHFRRDWSSAYDVGRKAAAQNLADVVAMGARPTALVLAFGAPATLAVSWATDLARGLADEARLAGAVVVGGDVVRSERVTLSVTALGDLGGRAPVTRSGAQVGDIVVLAGATGASAAGLAILQRDDAGLIDRFGDLVAAHRRPAPPYDAARALAELGATAMIDVSDGLTSELHHLSAASRVSIAVDQVPVSTSLRTAADALGVDAGDWAANGGEDHAILAAVPPHVIGAALAWATPIGVVGAGSGVTVAGHRVEARGWDHYGRTDQEGRHA
ncbi:MAG: thiamine-monophosphate kinase [Frankiales bacterium]|nr:thiamine-monophosphate kinase [Frankiales bacterium]